MPRTSSLDLPSDRHIRRLSLFLAWAISLIALVMPPLIWWIWLFPGASGVAATPAPGNGFGGDDLSWYIWPVRLGAAGLSSVAVAITLYGLYHLRVLFQEAARGAYFSAAAVIGFRQFALASLVGALWSPLEHTLMGVFLSVSNPNVLNALEVSLGTDNLESIGAALLFFLIAFILAEGRKRHEELELIL
ncbi:DUF2975 domain-containing protein [Maricaulis sp.]|uniref:DUF2975 domain-containing protein n=1 Tax=Maricaulis sp. TaxID=1486257 RepID=UPI0025B8EE8F|nr:DUF2975 domain-containing protein [Maricaulis sp.]